MPLLLLTVLLVGWFLILATSTTLFATRPGSQPKPLPEPLPRVSILIAARNEEAAIARCLTAIRQLNYPAHLLEVLLGDDASTDATSALAARTMQGFAGSFSIVPVQETLGLARGKANVLAHLTRAASSNYFFITDADIAVPPTWIQGMLAHAAPGVGTITGLTLVDGPRLFDKLQGLDWLMSLGLVQVVSDLGRPVTAMGNNMLVTRAAYEAIGGYEALPFSVTEDYALFQATIRQGFGYRIIFRPEVLAVSLPMRTLSNLLQQRRRWMHGAESLPWSLRGGALYYTGFYPLLVGLAWVAGPGPAALVLAVKMLLQGALAYFCYRRAGRRAPLWLMPLAELYNFILTFTLTTYRLLPLSFQWKGRRYK
ncbi:glycosyltransferase [Hymenobacter sp. BT186]|uniref:Glycosyltransferase n=1 Tax=Hymenobacter telluris TaxID=2816474 RepID=A0A939ESR4_9BACT|nr:glycosyltransferase [Hymenobacter telluris]MBO0356434.1 glycosyltransferase [Hymenobacter telluris]MBW3372458.1 glycosyltransferase [Hymenobacter norwichensis]